MRSRGSSSSMSDDEDQYTVLERHFSMRMRDVVRVEERSATMSEADQERLFRKVAVYLEDADRSIGIHTFIKLAFAPATISATRLEKMAAIICDKLFQPVAYTDAQILKYSDFYLCFAYLEGTKVDDEESNIVTFEEAFIKSFISKLAERFENGGNSRRMLTNSEIYEMEMCMGGNSEERDMKKVVDKNSIRFLANTQKVYPALILKVFEFLLPNFRDESYSYFRSLLIPGTGTKRDNRLPVTNRLSLLKETLNSTEDTSLICSATDMGKMTSGYPSTSDMYNSRYLPKLKSLKDSKERIAILAEDFLGDVNLKYQLIYYTNDCNPATPQDFIKLSLAKIARCGLKNDFEIDEEDEDEDECAPMDIRSIEFAPVDFVLPAVYKCYEWRGLKVHTLG